MGSTKEKLKVILSSRYFEGSVLIFILLNSVTLGLETSQSLMSRMGDQLLFLDRVFLSIFSLEIAMKLYAYRWRFYRDPWNLFDFCIVAIAWIPTAGPLSVLRAFRILRALRLITIVPALRRVVSGLLSSLPGLGAVSCVLLLLFYVGSVMATKLFGESFPEWFGTVGRSSFSLFQIMTLESWSMGIVRPVMGHYPYAWAFFIPFILITTFTTLNLLIAVLVTSLQPETETAAKERDEIGREERIRLLREVQDIKASIEKMKAP
ncbi:MAG: ion transporter [Bradymonadales bacterium]|nr:MAG: ion transporter [Bradymonadales bacterium]